MKFKAEKNRLSEAIISASKACASKTAFNALDGVLLNLQGDILTVTGYDLEIGIRVKIKVEGAGDGEIVVDARLFSDTVRRMPSSSPVEIVVYDEKEVVISSGKVVLTLQGVSGNNFPNIIELNDSVNFKINESVLKSMLSQVSHAISQSDMSPALKGAKFTVENGDLLLVASDGMRLALRKEKCSYSDIAFIVPEKTVLELTRNLMDESELDVTIIIDNHQICFMKDDYIIFSRLLDGKFVEYSRIVAFDQSREVLVNTREFAASLERSLLLITDKFKSPVICSFKSCGEEVEMNLVCKTSLGSFEEDIIVSHKVLAEEVPEEFAIAFNPKYMLDAVKNTCCDEIKMLFTGELAPIKLIPLSEGDFIFVVVPVRLK